MKNSSTIIRKSLKRIGLFIAQLPTSIREEPVMRQARISTEAVPTHLIRSYGVILPSGNAAHSALDGALATAYFGAMRAALKDLPPLVLASASPRRVEL